MASETLHELSIGMEACENNATLQYLLDGGGAGPHEKHNFNIFKTAAGPETTKNEFHRLSSSFIASFIAMKL